MTVRIITDSTTDVTPAAARQLNLGVVPLKVLFGQEEYRDGIDLTMEEFYISCQPLRSLHRMIF